jgi:anaerobic dimethyl sulfoxide reductase subunit B (iron-sulfur subunit)
LAGITNGRDRDALSPRRGEEVGQVNGNAGTDSMTFVVDMTRCTGCQACQIACRDRAPFPDDVDLLRVEAQEGGAYPTPALSYRVVHCFHCTQPPCEDSCPVGAIARDGDGLVALDSTQCTGCGACIDACPFEAVVMLAEGVTAKCDGCADQLAQELDPICVRACPMRALSVTRGATRVEAEGKASDESFDHHTVGPSVLFLRSRPR